MLKMSEILQDILLSLDSGMSLVWIEDPVMLWFSPVWLVAARSLNTVSNNPEEKFGIPQLKQVKLSSE